MTDTELNHAVATEVLGLAVSDDGRFIGRAGTNGATPMPDYANDERWVGAVVVA